MLLTEQRICVKILLQNVETCNAKLGFVKSGIWRWRITPLKAMWVAQTFREGSRIVGRHIFIPAAYGRRYMMTNGHTQYLGEFTSTETGNEIFRKMKEYPQDLVSKFGLKLRTCGLSPQKSFHYVSRLNNSEIRVSELRMSSYTTALIIKIATVYVSIRKNYWKFVHLNTSQRTAFHKSASHQQSYSLNRLTRIREFVWLFVFGATAPQWARASSFTRFLDHTQRATTVGRTPLDEWSACLRDLYLTTLNTQNRQASMPPVGFEPTISAGERPHTYVLDRAATGTGWITAVGLANRSTALHMPAYFLAFIKLYLKISQTCGLRSLYNARKTGSLSKRNDTVCQRQFHGPLTYQQHDRLLRLIISFTNRCIQ